MTPEYKGCDNCKYTEEELATLREKERQSHIYHCKDRLAEQLCQLKFFLVDGDTRPAVSRWPIDYGTDNVDWAFELVEEIEQGLVGK